MADKKVDLFGFFKKANKGDFRVVDEMTDEEVKQISAFVLLGWVLGTQSPAHIIMTDHYLNPFVFTLGNKPRLLLKLFIAANSDMGDVKYKYEKNKSTAETKEVKAIANYYRCTLREAKDYEMILSDEDTKVLVKQYELQKETK